MRDACSRPGRAAVIATCGGRELTRTAGGVGVSCVALQVVKAVAGAVPVLVDGGVRRGTDVLKALALGAKAVMVRTYARR